MFSCLVACLVQYFVFIIMELDIYGTKTFPKVHVFISI